jgi:hypothetical protein
LQQSGMPGSAMLSVAGRCPPLGVHIRSDVRGRVVRPSGVQPAGVRSSGWVVRDPAVRPAGVRPSGVRPAGVHPSVRSPPSRPRKPGGGLGDHIGAAGNRHDGDGSSCPWSGVSRAARSTARVGLEGRPGGGRAEAGGGASVADLAGSCSGAGCGHARPLTGQGPARREGRRWLPATPRHGSVG